MSQIKQPQSNKFRYLRSSRFWLAGPATLIVSIFIMAAMSLWLPEGKASIDHLVFPLVLFPLIWVIVFFYVVLENNIKRARWVMLALLLLNALPVIASILGWLK
ncbi:MAG: hypothetical protein COA90_00610 [Gammaproteobacteria bacterium]|nr:MAG: hypothetical protein COA90_00610 [Gammaproteobacteria bacterium]